MTAEALPLDLPPRVAELITSTIDAARRSSRPRQNTGRTRSYLDGFVSGCWLVFVDVHPDLAHYRSVFFETTREALRTPPGFEQFNVPAHAGGSAEVA